MINMTNNNDLCYFLNFPIKIDEHEHPLLLCNAKDKLIIIKKIKVGNVINALMIIQDVLLLSIVLIVIMIYVQNV